MVAKKTKTTRRPHLSPIKPKESQKKAAPPVAQMVVEVEDETSKLSEPMKEIEKDTEVVEKAAEKLEDDIDKELAAQETKAAREAEKELKTSGELEEAPAATEKTKDVVKEFFKPDVAEVSPEISVYKGNPMKAMVMWVLIILVVALATGGLLIMAVRGVPKMLPFALSKPTPTPTPAPTPTPTPSVKRADLKLQVLNGGGVVGAGSKMKDFLTGKGYTVSDVGNADIFSYKDTVVLVKPGKDAYLALLTSDLKDSYTVGTTTASLSADVSFDARVIVGQD